MKKPQALLTGLAFEIFGSILGGFLAGKYMGRYFGNEKLGILIGILLGFLTWLVRLFQILKQLNADHRREQKDD